MSTPLIVNEVATVSKFPGSFTCAERYFVVLGEAEWVSKVVRAEVLCCSEAQPMSVIW